MRSNPSRFKKNIGAVLLLLVLFGGFFSVAPTAKAIPTEETASVPQTVGRFLSNLYNKYKDVLQQAGSRALQATIRSALNKIAYDTATYVGSGGQGQQPLFVTKNWGSYLSQIGDEAAGQFIEGFASSFTADVQAEQRKSREDQNCTDAFNNCNDNIDTCTKRLQNCRDTASANYANALATNASNAASGKTSPSFNLCAPSLQIRMKLALGLVNQQRPARPNCSWSQMKNNWTNAVDAAKSQNFYGNLKNMFEPQSSDLSAALTLQTGLMEDVSLKTDTGKTTLIGKGGWIDPMNTAGQLVGLPDQAKTNTELAKQGYISNIGVFTGSALVDAGNVFLNQLSMTAFNRWMQGLQGGNSSGAIFSIGGSGSIYDSSFSGSYDYSNNKQSLLNIIKPQFEQRADYNVLADLAVCPDTKNPGPNNCVIDDKFMNAISEQKTVGEALKDGSLNGSWLMTANNQSASYRENYSLRNAMILRKFRILPVGWEAAIEKAASLGRNVTLMDMVSCFNDSDEFHKFSNPNMENNQAWCRGLVDPNWVLKAPQAYCAKSGYGNQILSSEVIQTGNTATGAPATTLSITRAGDYCADEKTCIKESSSGSCEAYGYCTEDRRTWNFGNNSCNPTFNSCETFADTRGNSVSYLKDTLNYGTCNSSNSGCSQYSTFGTYTSSTNKISWSGNNTYGIFLNSQAETCDSSSEGCRSLVRVKPSWGDNLIFDNDFSLDPINSVSSNGNLNGHFQIAGNAAITTEDQEAAANGFAGSGSAKILKISSGLGGLFSTTNGALTPQNSTPIAGYYYTLSAEIYLSSNSQSVVVTLGSVSPANTDNHVVASTTATAGSWQVVSVTGKPGDQLSSLDFSILGTTASPFYIRHLKLEANNKFSGWSNYGENKIQEKLIPAYLEAICYTTPYPAANSNYTLKDNAPDICKNFARRCNKSEVGCQNFTSADGFSVTGKVAFDEYCPQECVGYNSYVQESTNFQTATSSYFIPSTATACTAAAVGCSRFTNLDSVAQGGEGNEYYSSLRRCIQPDNTKCAAYYSWGGENESGYQLHAYSLQEETSGDIHVISNDSAECNQTIFNYPPSNPNYNPDCRQFYDSHGAVSYHLYSRTVTCSSDCRRMRLDESDINQADCVSHEGTWTNSTCIYQALPAASTACGAADHGCREYNGNSGNNVRIAASFSFEGTNAFSPLTGSTATTSAISTNRNGHSLKLVGSVVTGMSGLVKQKAAYSLKFLAKSSNPGAIVNAYFQNASGTQAYFSSTAVGDTDWRVYEINLSSLNHYTAGGEVLVIRSTDPGAVYLDSIVLTEITDRYYFLRDSWVTPDICYYDLNDTYRGAEYNLGCSAYQDQNGTTHNLRQFNSLCDSASAGCEAMIDTQNSASPFSQTFANSNVSVSSDQMIYAIFDSAKQCSSDNIGCSRLGKGAQTGANTIFSDVYLKNNPDNYGQTICQASDLGCDTYYDSAGGKNFFHNPYGNACQYRASTGASAGSQTWSWFKIAAKRCDVNNDGQISGAEVNSTICGSNSDCASGSCILDNNDYPCPVSYLKTIGLDTAGVSQPASDAGLCDAASSGCSEYIDSSSEVSPNLVVNPAFGDLDGDGIIGDFWNSSWTENGLPLQPHEPSFAQDIFLRAKKLYVARSVGTPHGMVDSFGNSVSNILVCDNFGGTTPVISILGPDNKIATSAVSQITLSDPGVYFIPKYDSVCHITDRSSLGSSGLSSCTSGHCTTVIGNQVDATANHAKSVELREAIVGYQNSANIDTKTCGSTVDPENGCVLFNQRTYNGAGGQLATLDKDVFSSPTVAGSFAGCSGNSCNANTVVKVAPNRVCSRWLACTTKIKNEKTGVESCYGLGECDKLDDKGSCANFIREDNTRHNFAYANDKNSTGYQLLDNFYLANMREVGNRSANLPSAINFEGDSVSFDEQVSYRKDGSISASTTQVIVDEDDSTPNGSHPRRIDEPTLSSNKKFDVSYPAEGSKFLEIPSNLALAKKGIALGANVNYYISYLVNTDALTPGAKASVKIAVNGSHGQQVLKEFTDRTNGWQRIIHRINVPRSSVDIFFGTEQDGSVDGKIYYDDISIEPVLQINNTGDDSKDYIAKECRLFPGEDSATCISRNESVINSGLEGYCLWHDPLNPGVCQQWLPMDNIVSATIGDKGLGYKSPALPLYYCEEANANFDVVEKRVMFRRLNYSYSNNNTAFPILNTTDGIVCEYAGNNNYNFCNATRYSPSNGHFANIPNADTDITNICGSTDYFVVRIWGWNKHAIFCIPDPHPINGTKRAPMPAGAYTELWVPAGWIFLNPQNSGDTWVPSTNDLNTNGWYTYNGSFTSVAAAGLDSNGECASVGDWCFYHYSEKENSAPPLRVYDFNNPPSNESDLKYINPGNSDADKAFIPTCNKFVKVLDENGNGWPWVDRLMNTDLYGGPSTPNFFPRIDQFGYSSPNNLLTLAGKAFNLALPSTPYGAALLHGTEIAGHAAIGFLTNYHKDIDGQTALAGRPYGCWDNSKGSCRYIGYCSKTPEVVCLTVNNDGDSNVTTPCPSSPSGNVCTSFGFQSQQNLPNYNAAQKNLLKNIFLKAFDSFELGESTSYSTTMNFVYDGTTATSANVAYQSPISQCSGTRTSVNGGALLSSNPTNDFCSVYPQIKNVNFYRGDGSGPAMNRNSDFSYSVDPGYYTLKFNSIVDAEQQPLGTIAVDWGDQQIDRISDQDNHPSTPHVISHNYGYAAGASTTNMPIRIKITDNWGLYACWPSPSACGGL